MSSLTNISRKRSKASPKSRRGRKPPFEGMVWIPGGTFLMGSNDHYPEEAPTHSVSVNGFWMDAHTVTNARFSSFVEENLQEGKLFALSFGRFNLLDTHQEDFFAGGGTERFLNIAQIGPLTVLRQVPLITNLVSFAYIKGGEPVITFAIMDPNDQSLQPGLGELFQDGVTFAPGFNFPVQYWGKSAKHSIGGAVTTKAYTPFDAIRQIVIPGPAINPVEPKRGSFSVNYVFRQYIVERARGDGRGLFTQVSFAGKGTSPVTTFFDIGLGGNGLFKSRSADEFGSSY